MVNTCIVSRYGESLPKGGRFGRKIAGGPLYPADEVLELIGGDGSEVIRAWARKCGEDLQKWSLDADDVRELLEVALRSGRFIGSEWCVQRPNGPWAACDAYSLVRREWVAAARREMDLEYYLKFAIARTGAVLLLVSCHPSEGK